MKRHPGLRGHPGPVLIPFKNGARVKLSKMVKTAGAPVLIPFKNGARVKPEHSGLRQIQTVLIPFKNGARVKHKVLSTHRLVKS